jgi:8-amino-7-oxononanoate synthase
MTNEFKGGEVDLLDKLDQASKFSSKIKQLQPNAIGANFKTISPVHGTVNGKLVILAGSNNYLGLTYNKKCIKAAKKALDKYGTGTTGSRLANGSYDEHIKLEQELAAFLNAPSAIVFTTGYVANLGSISYLAGSQDIIMLDSHCHSSIYEGAKLSGAQIYNFKHNDPKDLDKKLRRLGSKAKRTLVVVESMYSMLGDFCPLQEMCDVVEENGAYILLDDAHSFGITENEGRGLAYILDCERRVDFITGTFSKSLGSIGGFLVSLKHDIEPLRAQIKSYMFTASSTPGTVAATRQALKILQKKGELRDRLWFNCTLIHKELSDMGFTLGAKPSPVIAAIMPDPETASAAWKVLFDYGVYTNLVIPPGAPKNLSLLRLSISAEHSEDDCRAIIEAYSKLDIARR